MIHLPAIKHIFSLLCRRPRPGGLSRSGGPRGRTAPFRRRVRLPRQRAMRRRTAPFALQRRAHRPASLRRWPPPRRPAMAALIVQFCFVFQFRRALFWRWQLDSRPPRLGKPNGDRLLGRSCPVFPFANVVHLLADELAGLRRRRFPLLLILACPLQCFFFRHDCSLQGSKTELKLRGISAAALVPDSPDFRCNSRSLTPLPARGTLGEGPGGRVLF